MKFQKVLKFKGFNKIGSFFEKNRLLIFLSLCFLLGLLFGVYSKFGVRLQNFAEGYIENFINLRQGQSFFKIFFHSFMSAALCILLSFFLGTGVLGFLILPIASAAFGLIYGAVTSYLYSQFALLGVAFHTVILLPPTLLTLIAFILSAVQSVKFSHLLSGLVFYSRAADLSVAFKEFCKSFLFYLSLIFVSAIVDGLLSINFLESFVFI